MSIRLLLRTLRLSLSNFLANKSRNLLSVTTVTLGALATSAVFTVNKNVNEYVDGLMAKSGGPNLFVYSRSGETHFSKQNLQRVATLPSARYLVVDSEATVNILYNDKTVPFKLFKFSKDYLKARPSSILQGQFLSQQDYVGLSKNIVLSPTVVDELQMRDPVGTEVLLNFGSRNIYAKVVGTARADFAPDDRGVGWASRSLFEELVLTKEIGAFIVGTTSFSNLENFESRVIASVSSTTSDDVSIYNPRGYFDRLRSQYQTFINAGAAVGLLALVGGSVGVMNLMLMSVRLRVKEIGLYRALGFSTGVVLLIFLFESLITLGLGGFVGSSLGAGVGYLIAGEIVKTTPFFSLAAFNYALVSSITCGVLFSYIPAIKASKMDTVEALRS